MLKLRWLPAGAIVRAALGRSWPFIIHAGKLIIVAQTVALFGAQVRALWIAMRRCDRPVGVSPVMFMVVELGDSLSGLVEHGILQRGTWPLVLRDSLGHRNLPRIPAAARRMPGANLRASKHVKASW